MSHARRSSGRALIIFGPVLAIGAVIAVLAFLAGIHGWRAEEMRFIADSLGAVVMVLAIALFYSQARQRRLADQSLHNAQARVSGVIESAMDAIVTVDEHQRVVLFNAAAEKVFRRPRDAVLGQSLDILIPERLRSAHRKHIDLFGATGVTSRRMGVSTVLVGLRANDEEFPIEASISQHSENGRKLYTVILRDVTERTRVEAMLARDEARLRGILDSAMDAIITVDENERIVLFNKAAEEVFGWSRGEALGAPLFRFIPERYRGAHSVHIRRFGETSVASRRMGAQRIVTGLRHNGEEFPIDASISYITERGGKFYTVILRDVTERVRADEALRKSKEELRDLASVASSIREQEKSRIARELHDELAQALTALKMDLNWVKETLPANEHQIASKLEAMQIMVDSTVKATRRIAADLRPLMLDDLGLIPAAEWLVKNFTQRTGIQCEFSAEPSELELEDSHATAIFRMLQESLTNVAKHAQASMVTVTVDAGDGEITLRVRDNGRGFEPGKSRKPNSFGLVGLRERAYLLDGEVGVHSAPGAGTLIEVHIPLRRPASAA